ncbi:MAG: hypothetical protein M1834_002418 [Cirrosporium novae-zelandiae]|nr:MAG: hypothetical protein M1834_002418 [Cirrosporium novae-zelandiae]
MTTATKELSSLSSTNCSTLGASASTPDLSILPPTFVLSTHLTLEELGTIEVKLKSRGAPLTYDLSEATLVIGKIQQKKRAEFELRRGKVWTEEVSRDPEPSSKRRKFTPPLGILEERKQLNTEDSSNTESGDGGNGVHSPWNQTHGILSSPSVTSEFAEERFEGHIKIIKLAWLDASIQSNQILPLEEYIVYEGHPIPRPDDTRTSVPPASQSLVEPNFRHKPLFAQSSKPQSILDRAKGDANSFEQTWNTHQYIPTSITQKHIKARPRYSKTKPTRLLHQTTSQHDEDISGELPEMLDWVKQNKIYACERSTPSLSPNEDFINQLQKIKLARILRCDEVGVRAYSTSIASILAYPYSISNPREILALPGCDVKIAQLFREWKHNDGHIQEVEDIENDEALKVLRRFYEIWGVGAETARDFYYKKGWKDLDDIVEFGWSTLTRAQQIGVKYYDELQVKIPRTEIESIAATVTKHAKRVTGESDIECAIVGGYRRGKVEPGDVDIILSHRNPNATLNLIPKIISSLENEGWVTHTLKIFTIHSSRNQQSHPYRAQNTSATGFDTLDKALVVWQNPHFPKQNSDPKAKNPNIHRRVDILVSPWRTIGCAVLGWTSGTTFQRDLRRYAKDTKGWKFDSTGIRDRVTGKVVELEGKEGVDGSWEDAEKIVFEGLGLRYREPWERCTG